MDACGVVRVEGPLAVFRDGFRAELAALGYTPLSAANQLRVMAHLSRWLAVEEIGPGGLTPDRVQDFLAVRRERGYTCWLSDRGLAPLLDHLRGLGFAPLVVPPARSGPVEQILDRYHVYLADERGLVPSTIRYYEAEARLFLHQHVSGLEGLTAADVTGFIVRECAARRVGTAKILVTTLRCLLRFLLLEGLIEAGLTRAVPGIAGWRGGHLPKAIGAGQVQALLDSCDRGRVVGRRDYAILTLLVRLGLRACEAAALELADIDWRRGDLLIRGKGRRDERLPLPVDAGEAIVEYLCHGRPEGQFPQVFLRVRAPLGPLTAGAVKRAVIDACGRAGLAPVGAHRLRHTTATQLLQAGAPLTEIGQILRHRSAQTTAIYAKVDRDALRGIAQDWPGSWS